MVAFVLCGACSSGDCQRCEKGETTPGLIGGWACPCTHMRGEREDNKRRTRAEVERFFTTYKPFDQQRHLGPPPWTDRDAVKRWEAAHGHDVRTKCYVEYGCQAVQLTLDHMEDLVEELLDASKEVIDWWRGANEAPGGCSPKEAIDGMKDAVWRLEEARRKHG